MNLEVMGLLAKLQEILTYFISETKNNFVFLVFSCNSFVT